MAHAPLQELVRIPHVDRIPYFDKPPALGGTLTYLTPEEFKQKFGCDYSESMWGNSSSLKISQKKSAEFSGVEAQVFFEPKILEKELQEFFQKGNDQLAIGFINESVGHGVFARENIRRGTVLCLFSGIVKPFTDPEDDYVQTLIASELYVSAKAKRGMSGFMQHLLIDCEPYLKLVKEGIQSGYAKVVALGLCSQAEIDAEEKHAVEQTHAANPEFRELHFNVAASRAGMAATNVCVVGTVKNGVCVHALVAIEDINKHNKVGLSYGFDYWAERRIVPELFFKRGEVIPHNDYDRKRFGRCYLLKTLRDIFPYKNGDNFWSYIDNHEYSRALRMACTDKNYNRAWKLVNVLLAYKKEFEIHVNEQLGESKLAAIHHAAKAGNRKVVELLTKNGADVTLRDSRGKTAAEYLAAAESQALLAVREGKDKSKVVLAETKAKVHPFAGMYAKK